jgi:hypothetical protein
MACHVAFSFQITFKLLKSMTDLFGLRVLINLLVMLSDLELKFSVAV